MLLTRLRGVQVLALFLSHLDAARDLVLPVGLFAVLTSSWQWQGLHGNVLTVR